MEWFNLSRNAKEKKTFCGVYWLKRKSSWLFLFRHDHLLKVKAVEWNFACLFYLRPSALSWQLFSSISQQTVNKCETFVKNLIKIQPTHWQTGTQSLVYLLTYPYYEGYGGGVWYLFILKMKLSLIKPSVNLLASCMYWFFVCEHQKFYVHKLNMHISIFLALNQKHNRPELT